MRFIASYYRNGNMFKKSFTSGKRAASWVYEQELLGNISYVNIADSNGNILAENTMKAGYTPLFMLGAKQ